MPDTDVAVPAQPAPEAAAADAPDWSMLPGQSRENPAASATLAAAQAPDPRAQDLATNIPAPAAPTYPEQPLETLENIKKASWGSKVYHGILSAMGGQYDTQFIPTANGVIKNDVRATPGSQWKRIIAGAISGLGAAEANAGTGPGASARALGAGIQAGYKNRQEAYQQQRTEANEQFEQQQKAAMTNAQTSMLAQQRLNLQWDLTKSKMQATQDEITAQNNFQKVIASGGPGTRFVAHVPDIAAAIKLTKDDPSLHDQHAGGFLQYNDHIDPDGKHNGVDAYYVMPSLLDSKIPIDMTLQIPTMKDGKMVNVPQHIDKDTMDFRTFFNYQNLTMGQQKEQALIEQSQATAAHERQTTEDEKTEAPAKVDLLRAQAQAQRAAAGESEAKEELTRGKIIPFGTPIAVTDPENPPAQNFPAGTTGIVQNQIGKVPAATQKNADLARLIEHNTQHALNIINQDPKLLGKVMGRYSDFKEWVGTNDGNLAALHQDIENIAMPTVGIHGTRSQKLVDNEGKILFNNFKNGPDALRAVLQENLDSARTYLKEEQKFLHYGTATGPDLRLQLAAPGAVLPQPGAANSGIKQMTVDLTKMGGSATMPPGALGHVPVTGSKGEPLGEYWVSGDGTPMMKYTGK